MNNAMSELEAEVSVALQSCKILIRNRDALEDGTLRIATAFLYPNGSNIDVFIERAQNGRLLLTDLGGTSVYLRDLRIEMLSTVTRRQIVADICEPLKIICKQGSLQTTTVKLPVAIIRLVQACSGVAHALTATKRYTF